MPSPSNDLQQIREFPDLVRYLEDELHWPLNEYSFDDLTFEYSPDEVGLKDEDAAKIRDIRQLKPIRHDQPWGIFFVEFEKKKLPVVVLRRILNHLVLKKRASAKGADAPQWASGDILFISAFGDLASGAREIAFAHFQQEAGDLPTLRVLGWDGGDTPLHVAHVASQLKTRLRWPNDPGNAKAWREEWSKPFVHRIGHIIRTSNELAEVMAQFARRIRDAARTLMAHETERGALRTLYLAFQTSLIHDLTLESFADTYAQTITYGLLTAAISRTEMSGGRHGTALLAENIADIVPVTNPFLKEMLETFLKAGGRRGGIDFDELGIQDVVALLRGDETDLPAILRDFGNRTRGEDPVIHFYEHFLSAYNKQLKIQRGVFYTPQPVVSYIVRSVHELLQTEFGLQDGLADTTTWGEMTRRQPGLKLPNLSDDPGKYQPLPESEPFVQILDPATGTATFLVEVIEVIYRTLAAKWKEQQLTTEQQQAAWNDYVPKHLLPRLHAYELMMAPYAIAHMKIGLKLGETGYKFGTEERARIYLTNSLEPKVTQLPQIGFDALAHEAAAVNEIKWKKRFTVVIGNPPYSPSISEPAWLMRRLHDWKQGLNEAKSDLNREEWKFLRFAQHNCQITGAGIVGFIINRDFLDGIVKRRMREHLAETFPLRIAVDLNGDVKGNISDENVFEIEQGVTIAVLCTRTKKATLRFASRVGTRAQKYSDLIAKQPIDAALSEFEPASPYFRWQPSASTTVAGAAEEYTRWLALDAVFALKSSGIQTKNDPICIGWSADELFGRVERLAHLSEREARTEFGLENEGVWTLANAQSDLRQFGISRNNVRRILYRPMDFRFTYYTHKSSGFLGRPRYDLMRHMINGRNIGLIFNRQIVGDSVSHFLVSRDLTCHGSFYLGNKGQDYLAPLYLYDDDLLSTQGDKVPTNFTSGFNAALLRRFPNNTTKLAPEDIFCYAYAVFYSPGYRSRYEEFLKIDFPRLPLTGDLALFRSLARLGNELTALHLLESSQLSTPRSELIGSSQPIVEKVSWSNDTVWLDKAHVHGFRPVPETVWNFHVGGYQVCEKWLKDRKGRLLSPDDIAHYHKIVIALAETIRLMDAIDATIEQHGGWPDAFNTAEPVSV